MQSRVLAVSNVISTAPAPDWMIAPLAFNRKPADLPSQQPWRLGRSAWDATAAV
jgi:hypothetical protein